METTSVAVGDIMSPRSESQASRAYLTATTVADSVKVPNDTVPIPRRSNPMTSDRKAHWTGFWFGTVAALRKGWKDLLSRIRGGYSRNKSSNDIKWYSGTWCIDGCPNCPCKIEYVSFVGAYDTKHDKWISFHTDDVCPFCGAHLINACLASQPDKLMLDSKKEIDRGAVERIQLDERKQALR